MTTGRESLLSFVILFFLGACLSAQTVTEFPLRPGSNPVEIVAGPDGNLWFTEYTYDASTAAIGRITTAGSITEFPLPKSFGTPVGIASGPDGNLWFTQTDSENNLLALIGRITTTGVITEFPLPRTRDNPFDITAGPDGNLWFTEGTPGGNIGRITTAGTLTEFGLPAGGYPVGIAAGPDGNLWFTKSPDKIGRITTSGLVTEFPLPTSFGHPGFITAGPDGNLWFTEGRQIGRITPAGVITEFPIATPGSGLSGITTGPDGNVWFTETGAGKIGRLTIAHAPAIDLRILPVVGSTPGVGASFFRTSMQLHNPTSSGISGRIVFHASGVVGGDSDPALFYSLAPVQTQSIADLLPAMGRRSGLGSADIEVTAGAMPAVTVRVFNDAGAAGTTGFTEEPIRAEDALRPGQLGVLLLPADLTNFRFNLGGRTLDGGATVTLTLRDAAGLVVTTVARGLPPTYHEQQSAGSFLGVTALPAGGSLTVTVNAGAAIFYGATVDNMTSDPSLQIARPTP